ncbi:hypothetical protein FOA52_013133 [Chlamydomonas sp. UWO 241]|nr:hypothetical protein FOA52_013133 [Chlamydomonas sp. UWO 241]
MDAKPAEGGCTYWFEDATCTIHGLCPDCAGSFTVSSLDIEAVCTSTPALVFNDCGQLSCDGAGGGGAPAVGQTNTPRQPGAPGFPILLQPPPPPPGATGNAPPAPLMSALEPCAEVTPCAPDAPYYYCTAAGTSADATGG